MKSIVIGDMTVKVADSKWSSSRIISDRDREMDKRAKAAVKAAIQKAKICKKPIAGYDLETKKAFVENPDGTKTYVD
ncbi:hypothetical protein [Butyrivibrio sp. XPD2002]|uniref:hypothetical protein n=1 Tax=Butyrivibrio sp. XPD2002 TaxID=1280665 RepID=UPI00040083D5|nr:hypothetical protein [Butyrivibrio sp. XPD2002]